MAKRRTRREKEKARHQFSLSWKTESKKDSFEPVVKRQFQRKPKSKKHQKTKGEMANLLEKNDDLASVKRDIVRSLLIASLILSLELMLYLTWR